MRFKKFPVKHFFVILVSVLITINQISECVKNESITISAISIQGHSSESLYPPKCVDVGSEEDIVFVECGPDYLPNKGPQLAAVITNLQIVNKTIEIGPDIAETNRIVLICNASCPVHWRFYPAKVHLNRTFTDIEVVPLRQIYFDENGDIVLTNYNANLTIQSSSNEMTGKYVCECVQNVSLTDYVYVFLEERDKPYLVNQGDLHFKYPQEKSAFQQVDLSCGLSKPGQQLFLYTEDVLHPNPTLTQVMFPNASILHDPFTGFILKGSELPGLYEFIWHCTTTQNVTAINRGASVQTLPVFKETTEPANALNEFSQPYSFPVDSKMACCRMTCPNCSIAGVKPPSMAAYIVKNSITASLLKPLLGQRVELRKALPTTSWISACQITPVLGENETRLTASYGFGYTLNCQQDYVRMATVDFVMSPCAMSPPGIEEARAGFIFVCDNNGPITTYDRHVLELTSATEYFPALNGKRSILIGNGNLTHFVNTTMRLTMLPTAGNLYTIYSYQTDGEPLVPVRQWSYFPNRSIQGVHETTKVPSDSNFYKDELREVSRNIATEGEPRCFLCEASRYHFASGLIWNIDWVNGSKTYYDQDNERVKEKQDDEAEYYAENKNMPPRLTSQFCPFLRFEMQKISCQAPEWSSPDWKTMSAQIPLILKSDPPSIQIDEGDNFEMLAFTKTPIQLSCKFKTGSAIMVSWFINDFIVQKMVEPTPSCLLTNCELITNKFALTSSDFNEILDFDSTGLTGFNVTCRGHNSLGSASKSFWVRVVVNTVPRVLGPKTETYEFQYGDVNQILNCSVEGFPRPNQVIWYKDDGQVIVRLQHEFHDVITEYVRTNTTVTTDIYEFPEVNMNTAGTYICTAYTMFRDSATKKFKVIVIKPRTMLFVIVGSSVLVILLSVSFVFLLIKYRNEDQELRELARDFRKGDKSALANGEARRRHLALPWTGEYEINQADWEKDRKLDKGEFGEIWLSRLKTTGNSEEAKEVAIKCLPEKESMEESAEQRQKRMELLRVLCSELKMMMLVHERGSNSNIVSFIGATTKKFQKTAEIYIIMEFCHKGSLKTYISAHQKDLFQSIVDDDGEDKETASPEIAKWAMQIACGMNFLSSNGILHIDLAARNVLLTDDLVAKIGDFGLSRNLYGKKVYHRKEVGLPESWAAPECLKHDIITVESDVWSYGVTIWELYSKGSDPKYGNTNIYEELKSGNRLPRPSGATEATYDLMMKCWNLRPSSRPKFEDIISFFDKLSKEKAFPWDSEPELTSLVVCEPEHEHAPEMNKVAGRTNNGTKYKTPLNDTQANCEVEIEMQIIAENNPHYTTAKEVTGPDSPTQE